MNGIGRAARVLAAAALVASTIGCDRITKQLAASELSGHARISLAADLVRLEYTENAGGFLSFGAELPAAARSAIFKIGTGILLAGLGVLLYRRLAAGYWAIGPALLLAGGLANLLDRVTGGQVVDFLNIGVGGLRTGIFNVADVAITLGLVLVVVERARARPTGLAGE